MPRPRNTTPTVRKHSPGNTAYIDFYDPVTDRRRSVCLGKWGSKEAKQEHARIVAELAAGRTADPANGLSVNELFVTFLKHAAEHYRRPDGTQTNELANFKDAIKVAAGCTDPPRPRSSARSP